MLEYIANTAGVMLAFYNAGFYNVDTAAVGDYFRHWLDHTFPTN